MTMQRFISLRHTNQHLNFQTYVDWTIDTNTEGENYGFREINRRRHYRNI